MTFTKHLQDTIKKDVVSTRLCFTSYFAAFLGGGPRKIHVSSHHFFEQTKTQANAYQAFPTCSSLTCHL